MINVNQITAQLARMPDQALQQYAQMHKADPYVLSLALAESNRRKDMRQGAQMNAPQQPKVVDQAIQGMAAPMPESVGIGQLPAGDMNFADGGIVAFAGGGVPRYNGSQGSLLAGTEYDIPGMTRGDVYAKALAKARSEGRKPVPQDFVEAAASVGDPMGTGFAEMTSAPTGRGTFMQRLMNEPQWKIDAAEQRAAQADKRKAPALAATAPAEAAPKPDTGVGDKTAPAADKSMYSLSTRGAGFAPGQGLGLASTPSTLGREYESFMPEGAVADPFAAQTQELGQAGIKAAKEYKETREKQLDALGLFGLDQEKRLNERQAKLSKQEGDVGPLALLQAGFAMMAGTSPYAMQNIGIGAQAGLKSYTEGTDKLEAAREKLDDAFSRLEATRRSERMLTDKERAELALNVKKAVMDSQRLALDGAKQAYGWNREKAKTLFEAYTKERLVGAETASRERLGLAQIAAQRDIAGQRMQLMQDLYGGEVKARQEFGKIQMKVMSDLQKDSSYQLADPAKKAQMETDALRRAMQNNPFMASYAAGIGFTKAPPPGKVLDLTE